MKALIHCLVPVVLISLSTPVYAQWSLPLSGCSVRYLYDEVGNRTERSWYCWTEEGYPQGNVEILDAELQSQPLAEQVGQRVLEVMDLKLAPNPASDGVTIILSQPVDIANYDVYDAHGRSVFHGKMHGNHLDIPTTSIPSGLYNFCLVRRQEMLVRPFVVEH